LEEIIKLNWNFHRSGGWDLNTYHEGGGAMNIFEYFLEEHNLI